MRSRRERRRVKESQGHLPLPHLSPDHDEIYGLSESACLEHEHFFKRDEHFKEAGELRDTQKKLPHKIKADIIRDIFKYKYFLKISDPIRIESAQLVRYRESLGYKILCHTRIVLSVWLNRTGDFVSIDANPKGRSSVGSNRAAKDVMLDSERSQAALANMVRGVFNAFDLKAFKSIFEDVFAIPLNREISCESGDLAVIDGQLTYAFDLVCGIGFCLFLDTDGNFLGISFSRDPKDWKALLKEHFAQNCRLELNLFNT